jgi:phosphate transport system substrate-binding protein
MASADASIAGLTVEQVADAYAGRMQTWPDGKPLRLVLRSAFESETLALKTLSPEVARAVDLALKRRDLPIPENDLEALALIARVNGSLGSSSLGLILSTQARVRTLSLQGREPTLAHLISGVYPWSRSYWLVQRAEASPAVRSLVTLLTSQATLRSLQPWGYAAAA